MRFRNAKFVEAAILVAVRPAIKLLPSSDAKLRGKRCWLCCCGLLDVSSGSGGNGSGGGSGSGSGGGSGGGSGSGSSLADDDDDASGGGDIDDADGEAQNELHEEPLQQFGVDEDEEDDTTHNCGRSFADKAFQFVNWVLLGLGSGFFVLCFYLLVRVEVSGLVVAFGVLAAALGTVAALFGPTCKPNVAFCGTFRRHV